MFLAPGCVGTYPLDPCMEGRLAAMHDAKMTVRVYPETQVTTNYDELAPEDADELADFNACYHEDLADLQAYWEAYYADPPGP